MFGTDLFDSFGIIEEITLRNELYPNMPIIRIKMNFNIKYNIKIMN